MSKRVPQNKVGHNLPSETEAIEMSNASTLLLTKALRFGPPLGPEESSRLTIVRVGYEPMAELVTRLAERTQLRVSSASVGEVRADMALVKHLDPIYQDTLLAARMFRDVLRQARSEAWDGVMSLYSVLRVMSKTDPELSAALRPMFEFMAREAQERPLEKSEDSKK